MRPRYSVVCDSAADIGQSRARALGVTVVPLPVSVGAVSFCDGDLSQAELFSLMEQSGNAGATSQPSPATLELAYAEALETADEVIAIHISSRLSSTIESARTVAEKFDGRVHVFDSLNLSWGIGWQVVDAARSAQLGSDVETALDALKAAREQTKIVVTLDSLDNLNRSGRIGAVGKYVGALLNLKVSVAVNGEGAFVPVRASHGDSAANSALVKWVEQHMEGAVGGSFAIGHALASDRAQVLAAAIRERWEVDELVMYEAGSAIAVHAGAIWGVAFRPRLSGL